MLLRRILGARAGLWLITLTLVAVGCASSSPPPTQPVQGNRCSPAHLDVCERAIAKALSEAALRPETVAEYMAARASLTQGDAWQELYRKLVLERAKSKVAVVVESSKAGKGTRRSGADGSTWIDVPTLPALQAIDRETLLLAIGSAGGYHHLIHQRGNEAWELFPGDPLEPFMAGVPAVVRTGASGKPWEGNMILASLVRRALQAAGAFRYVEAAETADTLEKQLKGRSAFEEPVLRARYALDLLASAGISLEDEASEQDTAHQGTAEPPPSSQDTPYGDLLRIRTAKDEHAAWSSRGKSVLRAVALDRQDAVRNLLGKVKGCSQMAAPPMEDVRDLIFAGRLAGALATTPSQDDNTMLPLPAWLDRYEALVRNVDATHSVWSYAPSMLYQRGGMLGLNPAGTSTYRRATDLGLAHVRALKELVTKHPRRYRALSQLPLVYNPGVLADDRLRDAVIELSQTTVQNKLASAQDASGVWSGVLVGVLAGLSYPSAVQSAHYLALQGALTAKLRGDLTRQTGWSVAGLYAADALYRLLTDQAPNLPFSSAQIERSLTNNTSIPYPSLAALVTSLTRYALLGVEQKLEIEPSANVAPERRAAKEALKQAIAGLADSGETPPAGLLADVTSLADGLIAVVATEVLQKTKPSAAGSNAAASCSADWQEPGPAMRRAMARLNDLRRRVLLSPRYKQGDSAWLRRARLLVTLLSDTMDIAGKTGSQVRFQIGDAEAAKTMSLALRDWDERELSEVLVGGYELVRVLMTAKDGSQFMQQGGKKLRRVVSGLQAFLRKDQKQGSMGVAMLDALATMPMDAAMGDGLSDLLVGYAKAFYAKGQRDQGDLWLLSSLVVTAIADSSPPGEIVALATQNGSRVSWVLQYLTEIYKAKQGVAPNPDAYAAAMKNVADDACTRPDATQVLTVMTAVHDFANGRRSKARAALDQVLETADNRGLHIPRITYRYEEQTTTRVFALSFDISYGAGILEGPNTFQLGVGIKSRGEPEGSMRVTAASADSSQAAEEAARYYIHTAALAAAYHFLEGDHERGAAAARRALQALSFGVRLGSRAVLNEQPIAWGKDARVLLALDAQLAAEAGRAFLAGDLWTVVRAILGQDTDDKALEQFLASLPAGVAAVKDIQPLVARTAKSLAVVAAPLPCTQNKVDLGLYEEPACDTYPLALSFRIADVLKKLPRLRRTGSAAQCASLRNLDTFLTAADKGTYDPDAFTAAVGALRTDGKLYDAAVLLSRHRREGHCSPVLTSTARALGHSALLGSMLRADLLSIAVNCEVATLGTEVVGDLMAIDEETRRLADLGRNLRLVLFVTDLSVQKERWDILEQLTGQPEFVERWMGVSPQAATAALLIQQASAVLAGRSKQVRGGSYELFCETFPPGDRAEMCTQIKLLREGGSRSAEQRRRDAKEALRKLVAAVEQSTRPSSP